MESVGQQLREARLRLGLTLENVSASTRINVAKLAAIEQDDLTQFSSRFLYRSFVRQIGVAVSLTREDVEAALPQTADRIPEPLIPGQLEAPLPPQVTSLKPERIRVSRWVSSAALLALVLAACSTLYAYWQTARGKVQASAETHRVQAVAAVQPAAGTGSSNGNPADGNDVHIQVSASAPTWVSVTSDGKQVFSGILQAAETKVLEGRQTARLRTGNAGGVQVVFNGRAIGVLGDSGQVRTAVFTKNGYEILEPQARAERPAADVPQQN